MTSPSKSESGLSISVPVFFILENNIFDVVWRRILIGRRVHSGDARFRRLNVASLYIVDARRYTALNFF